MMMSRDMWEAWKAALRELGRVRVAGRMREDVLKELVLKELVRVRVRVTGRMGLRRHLQEN
jgi:hypothetical protein